MVTLISGFSAYGQALPLNEVDKGKIEEKLARMTLEEKVGQMFVLGFRGQQIDGHIRGLIHKFKPGSFIVFRRNIRTPQQIFTLNKQIQELSLKEIGLPMLLMVDQEGGTVTRIKTNPAPPSALALGMTEDTKLVRDAGAITGKIVSLLGFNMNLAPVMDLSDPYQNSFIGNRSFGQNPQKVKLYGEAYSTGLADSGVIPTSKHYPGHGGVITDSHLALPKKLDTLEQLEKSALIPFDWFAKFQYPSAIMVAHIAFPNIDPSGVPATFSKMLIEDVLRKRANYPGLVITDDIEMSAAGTIGGVGERAVRSIIAGCDQVMVAWTPRKQREALIAVRDAVESGRITLARVDESVRRILRVKLSLNPKEKAEVPRSEFLTQFTQLVGELKDITNRVSQANLDKSMRGYSYLEGAGRDLTDALVFTADPRFFYTFRDAWGQGAKFRGLSPKYDPKISKALAIRPDAIAIYYATGTGTVRILNNLDETSKARMLVVNTTNPGAIFNTNQFLAVVNLNSRNFRSGAWIAEYLKKEPSLDQLREPTSEANEARLRVLRKRKLRLQN